MVNLNNHCDRHYLVDPELELIYLRSDHVVLKDLLRAVYLWPSAAEDPRSRLRLMVHYSFQLMNFRIKEAKALFYARHPGAWPLTIHGDQDHLNEEQLIEYFSGRITSQEARAVEWDGHYCPTCGWQLIGAGRTLTSFGIVFDCQDLIRPGAIRTHHLHQLERLDWQTREKRRELLRHLKICRRCRWELRQENTLPPWLAASRLKLDVLGNTNDLLLRKRDPKIPESKEN